MRRSAMKQLFFASIFLSMHCLAVPKKIQKVPSSPGMTRNCPSWIDENFFPDENNSSKKEEPGPIAQLARLSERESFAVDKELKKKYRISLPSRKKSLPEKIVQLFRSKSSVK